jgi:hypothetical protein
MGWSVESVKETWGRFGGIFLSEKNLQKRIIIAILRRLLSAFVGTGLGGDAVL